MKNTLITFSMILPTLNLKNDKDMFYFPFANDEYYYNDQR